AGMDRMCRPPVRAGGLCASTRQRTEGDRAQHHASLPSSRVPPRPSSPSEPGPRGRGTKGTRGKDGAPKRGGGQRAAPQRGQTRSAAPASRSTRQEPPKGSAPKGSALARSDRSGAPRGKPPPARGSRPPADGRGRRTAETSSGREPARGRGQGRPPASARGPPARRAGPPRDRGATGTRTPRGDTTRRGETAPRRAPRAPDPTARPGWGSVARHGARELSRPATTDGAKAGQQARPGRGRRPEPWEPERFVAEPEADAPRGPRRPTPQKAGGRSAPERAARPTRLPEEVASELAKAPAT